MSKGILLDENNDLAVLPRRDATGMIKSGWVIGDSLIQNTFMVLMLKQGECKEEPIIGVNLLRMICSKESKEKIRKEISIGLARAGIPFDEVKEQLEVMINKQKTEL